MRLSLYLFPLLLAACSQAAPGPSQSAAETPAAPQAAPSAANADTLALQQTPAAGEWSAIDNSGVAMARFGEHFILACSTTTRSITLTFAGTSAQRLRLITATRTLDLAARSGSVRLDQSAPEHDALISTLGTPGDRFALDAGGTITVFPWNDALATTLSACR